MRRHAAAAFGTVLGLAMLLLLAAPPADAHAYLSTSNPADGASLTSAPAQLELGFSEAVMLGATSLELVDSRGVHLHPTALRIVSSSDSGNTEEPVTLFATLPKLAPSAYRLSWATLSRDDLHRTSGVIVFGVGQPVTAAGQHEPRPPQDEVGLRWLLFTGLALGAGGVLAARLLIRRDDAPAAARLAYRIAAIGAAASALVAGVLLLKQAAGAGVGTVLTGRYGEGWLSREGGLVLLAVLAAIRSRQPRAGRGWFALLGAISIGASCAGSAMVGHSASGGASYLIADTAHLGAAAAWSGCPLVLLLAARRGRRGTLRAALLGFARPATLCVGIVVVSGIYLVSGVVGSVDAGIATFYGRVLLIKMGLFAIIALLGWTNYRLLRRPVVLAERRTVLAEVVASVLVLGLAGVLTSSQPAREPQYLRAAPATLSAEDTSAADLQQTLSIQPNLPGRNVVVLGVFDTRRPAPGAIVSVQVVITDSAGVPAAPITAQALPDRTWSAPVQLTASGRSTVAVTVLRAGLPPVHSVFEWTVRPNPQSRSAVILSNTPIRSPLQKLAIVALCLAATAGLIGWRRRPERFSSSAQPTPVAVAVAPQLTRAGAG
jgi:copper transport protein